MSGLRVIAHRCRGFGAPENSEAAVWRALASPADELEVDLRGTKEGRLVVWHDPVYRDSQGMRWRLSRTPLRRLERAGLLSLERLLRIVAWQGAGKRLNLDLKTPGLEEELVAAIRHHRLEGRVLLVSWNAASLERLHALAPELSLSLSFAPKVENRNGYPYRPAVRLPRILRQGRVPLATVNLAPLRFPVTGMLVRRIRRLGPEVVVCNVDSARGNERLARLGVQGTMTNRPLETWLQLNGRE